MPFPPLLNQINKFAWQDFRFIILRSPSRFALTATFRMHKAVVCRTLFRAIFAAFFLCFELLVERTSFVLSLIAFNCGVSQRQLMLLS